LAFGSDEFAGREGKPSQDRKFVSIAVTLASRPALPEAVKVKTALAKS
jgi:hypothetical protein